MDRFWPYNQWNNPHWKDRTASRNRCMNANGYHHPHNLAICNSLSRFACRIPHSFELSLAHSRLAIRNQSGLPTHRMLCTIERRIHITHTASFVWPRVHTDLRDRSQNCRPIHRFPYRSVFFSHIDRKKPLEYPRQCKRPRRHTRPTRMHQNRFADHNCRKTQFVRAYK